VIGSSFVQGLDESDVRTVMGAATIRRLAPHELIYEQGRPASNVFLLSTGRARYFSITPDGRKILLHWLVPGDLLGIAAMQQRPCAYRVGAETVRLSSLLSWDRDVILELIQRYPRLLHNALSVAVDYLDLYIAAHSALVSETARQRLASVLVRLTGAIGQEVPGGVELQVTNEELASAANITLFTASRIMSEWQADHTVTKRRGRIILHSPNQLLRMTA
jgi:CRP/FNR family transcriptional regulator, nitrogen oxide reductase regulator